MSGYWREWIESSSTLKTNEMLEDMFVRVRAFLVGKRVRALLLTADLVHVS